MNDQGHPITLPSRRSGLPRLMLAIMLVCGVSLLVIAAMDAPSQPAPQIAPSTLSAGSLIDHSVIDRDDLQAEPDPSPRSVAAYGN